MGRDGTTGGAVLAATLCGFLILFDKLLSLIIAFCFFQGVHGTRDGKKKNTSDRFLSKAGLGLSVLMGTLLLGRHGLAHLEADGLVPRSRTLLGLKCSVLLD